MALSWKDVSTFEAMHLQFGEGFPRKGVVLVNAGPCKVKRYTFKRRQGDGHYLVRWGRLAGAKICYDNGTPVSIIFNVAT